ncbi:Rho GTPase activation protein (RhoGAP) with PHdomain [Striga asiatica]|uniref:Rho GTPase activation protein (RhoGAP) with PHdomain n=1 Tax=Striga asiatica TaxID=4170 RepID=A0A5A7PDZ9_STRAF|nr:Rho GTPase activation protein (RhoGAP) with PHdomain [Striga asiatica]
MSRLNANAKPFFPGAQTARQVSNQPLDSTREERSLFMTFSIGSPLVWREISQHFKNEYGECVENVYVHDGHSVGRPNKEFEFGRTLFTNAEVPNMIMGNNEKVKLRVGGKPLWLKRYVALDQRPKQ